MGVARRQFGRVRKLRSSPPRRRLGPSPHSRARPDAQSYGHDRARGGHGDAEKPFRRPL